MEPLRPNEHRAKIAIMLIWIAMAMDIISLISGYFQYKLLRLAEDGGEISSEVASANDLREQVIAIVSLIVSVISIVTFIRWFRRAYFNLHQRVNHLSHSEGWAAGSWFIPIVCLFRPFQIMRELYQETKELLDKNAMDSGLSVKLLVPWWTLWVIDNLIGQFEFRYSMKAESVQQLILSTEAGALLSAIGVPLAIVTVKVIKDYSAAEPLLMTISSNGDLSGRRLNPPSDDILDSGFG